MSVAFPITVRFEDGEMEEYESVEDIEQDLEDFDSDEATDCQVRDALGRLVRLRVKMLELEELSLIPESGE